MAEEQKTPVTNAEAEKDVQNVLAELKGENATSAQPAQDADEARIVAEAAKLGEKSEKEQEKSSEPQEKRETRTFQRGGRGGRGGARYKTKFDPSTLEETDDPVEIRKQVSMALENQDFTNSH
jgi:lupus La protein